MGERWRHEGREGETQARTGRKKDEKSRYEDKNKSNNNIKETAV